MPDGGGALVVLILAQRFLSILGLSYKLVNKEI